MVSHLSFRHVPMNVTMKNDYCEGFVACQILGNLTLQKQSPSSPRAARSVFSPERRIVQAQASPQPAQP